MGFEISLRDVLEDDISILFEQQQDPESNFMAAFISRDPNDWEAFKKHWAKIMLDDTVYIKIIVSGDHVVGHILSFIMFGKREIGYWIGKEYWGKGIATNAVNEFIDIIGIRPLYAHVAFDNIGSRRVLEKCGFSKVREDKYFAKARGEEIVEYIYEVIR
jgi:RimJ/RimL family protein N-acetyltransferase